MNKELLKDLIALKLKTIDKILDGISMVSDRDVKKYYQDFLDVVNEAVGNHIKEAVTYKGGKEKKGIKNIHID